MRTQHWSLERKFLVGVCIGFLVCSIISAFNMFGGLPNPSVGIVAFVTLYEPLSFLWLPIIVALGVYYSKRWHKRYPIGMVIVPNLIFLIIFGSIITQVAYQAIIATQLMYVFPIVQRTSKRGVLFYVGLVVVFIVLWLGLLLLSNVVASAVK